MDRVFFGLGALSALVAVAAGAFGAHALARASRPDMLGVFEIGARYHMYHALALLAAGWAVGRWPGGAAATAGWLFVAGTVIFSGSLYLLAAHRPALARRRHSARWARLHPRLGCPRMGGPPRSLIPAPFHCQRFDVTTSGA